MIPTTIVIVATLGLTAGDFAPESTLRIAAAAAGAGAGSAGRSTMRFASYWTTASRGDIEADVDGMTDGAPTPVDKDERWSALAKARPASAEGKGEGEGARPGSVERPLTGTTAVSSAVGRVSPAGPR